MGCTGQCGPFSPILHFLCDIQSPRSIPHTSWHRTNDSLDLTALPQSMIVPWLAVRLRPRPTGYLYAVCFTGSQSGGGGVQRTDSTPSFLLSFSSLIASERCLPFSFVRNGHAQTSNRSGGGALKFEIENTQNGFVRLHLFNRLLC